jgi:long-subunit fatty acid transport protein
VRRKPYTQSLAVLVDFTAAILLARNGLFDFRVASEMQSRSRDHTPVFLRRLLLVAVALALFGPVAAAVAAPLENGRYGGLYIGSAVEPHPANILRNPAAIGMVGGTHVFLDGTVRLEHGRVQRAAIRSDTGNPGPGADLSFDSVRFTNLTPEGYFGITTDLGSNLVVIGVALLTPFAERQLFPGTGTAPDPSQEGPLKYHRIESQWYHLFVSPVVAIRAHKRFFIGLGMSYVRSMFNMVFARDRRLRDGSVPPYEDGLSTERVHIQGAENSFSFNLGIVARLPWGVDVGLSYRSRVVGVNQDNIRAEGSARVTRWDADSGGWKTYSGRARTAYDLPDALTLGAKWAYKSWDFGFGLEWSRWSVHDDIRFTLTGNEFRGEAAMTNWDVNFKHYRGFQDVVRVSVSAAKRWGKKLKLTVGSMYESSAVPNEWISAASMDSHKLDLMVGLLWRPHKNLGLYLGYGVILAPAVRVSHSGFDPGHLVRCVEDRVDILWSENCRSAIEGKGLPSAAGLYWMMTHRFGFGISYDYW